MLLYNIPPLIIFKVPTVCIIQIKNFFNGDADNITGILCNDTFFLYPIACDCATIPRCGYHERQLATHRF
jgi:hypothetical protein